MTRENHVAPAELQVRLARAGGCNRYGEANFRVMWGWSRLAWIGGKWTDTDASGNVIRQRIEMREQPKYFPFDRWHIERWMPPETYGSPELWYSQTIEREDGILIPALGPYPRRGEYEHCFTLQGAGGNFFRCHRQFARELYSRWNLRGRVRRKSIARRLEKGKSGGNRNGNRMRTQFLMTRDARFTAYRLSPQRKKTNLFCCASSALSRK